MAIEKVRTRKFEFSTPTIIQLSVAGVLVLLSLILGLSAIGRWQLKSALLSAYAYYDSNQPQLALPELNAAVDPDDPHVGALQLRAKIFCDTGKLDKAEADYKKLIAVGYDRPHIRCGLGVVTLKQASQAEAGDVEGLVDQARAYFEAGAGRIPEADIGLGHCDLLLAARLNKPSHLEAAKKQFLKVKADLEGDHAKASSITRDGLIDYYSGLGRALGGEGKYNEEAAKAFKASFQLARGWPAPMANILASESLRLSQTNLTLEQLDKETPDLERLRSEMLAIWSASVDRYAAVKEAWLSFSLALAKAYADAHNTPKFSRLVYQLQNGGRFDERHELVLFRAAIQEREALRPDLTPKMKHRAMVETDKAYRAVVQSVAMSVPELKDLKAVASNNNAWALAYLGDKSRNPRSYQNALGQLTAAIALKDDEYVFHRNAVVVMKRLRLPAGKYQKHLDRAGELRKAGDEQDYQQLVQYATGK